MGNSRDYLVVTSALLFQRIHVQIPAPTSGGSQLSLQRQGIGNPLLASVSTCTCMVCACTCTQTCAWAYTHTHTCTLIFKIKIKLLKMFTEMDLQQTSLLLPLVGKLRSQSLRSKWLDYMALLFLYFIPAFMSTFRVCGAPSDPKGNLPHKTKLKILSDILSLREKDYHLQNKRIKAWLIFFFERGSLYIGSQI